MKVPVALRQYVTDSSAGVYIITLSWIDNLDCDTIDWRPVQADPCLLSISPSAMRPLPE